MSLGGFSTTVYSASWQKKTTTTHRGQTASLYAWDIFYHCLCLYEIKKYWTNSEKQSCSKTVQKKIIQWWLSWLLLIVTNTEHAQSGNEIWAFSLQVNTIKLISRVITQQYMEKKKKRSSFFLNLSDDTLADRWRGVDHTAGGHTLT